MDSGLPGPALPSTGDWPKCTASSARATKLSDASLEAQRVMLRESKAYVTDTMLIAYAGALQAALFGESQRATGLVQEYMTTLCQLLHLYVDQGGQTKRKPDERYVDFMNAAGALDVLLRAAHRLQVKDTVAIGIPPATTASSSLLRLAALQVIVHTQGASLVEAVGPTGRLDALYQAVADQANALIKDPGTSVVDYEAIACYWETRAWLEHVKDDSLPLERQRVCMRQLHRLSDLNLSALTPPTRIMVEALRIALTRDERRWMTAYAKDVLDRGEHLADAFYQVPLDGSQPSGEIVPQKLAASPVGEATVEKRTRFFRQLAAAADSATLARRRAASSTSTTSSSALVSSTVPATGLENSALFGGYGLTLEMISRACRDELEVQRIVTTALYARLQERLHLLALPEEEGPTSATVRALQEDLQRVHEYLSGHLYIVPPRH